MLKQRIRLITFILSSVLILQTAIPYSMNITYAEESTESEDGSEDSGEDEPTDEIEPSESNPSEAEPTEAEPTEAEPSEVVPTEDVPTETEPTEEEPTVADPVIGGGLNVVDGEGVIFDLDDGGDDDDTPSGNESPSRNEAPKDKFRAKFKLNISDKYFGSDSLSENGSLEFGEKKYQIYVNNSEIEIECSMNMIGDINTTDGFYYFIDYSCKEGKGTISSNNSGNRFTLNFQKFREIYPNSKFESLDVKLTNIYGYSKVLNKDKTGPLYKIEWDGDPNEGDPSIWHFDNSEVKIATEGSHSIENHFYVKNGSKLVITAKNDYLASLSATVSADETVSGFPGWSHPFTGKVSKPDEETGKVNEPGTLELSNINPGEYHLSIKTSKLMPGQETSADDYTLRVTSNDITVESKFYGEDNGEKNDGKTYGDVTYYRGDVKADISAGGGAIDGYSKDGTKLTRKDGGGEKDVSASGEWDFGSRKLYYKGIDAASDEGAVHDISYSVRDVMNDTGKSESKKVAADHSEPEVSMIFEKENGEEAAQDGIYNETIRGEAIVSDADGHMNAELTELKAEGASAGGWNTAEDGKSIYNKLTFSNDGKYKVSLAAEDMAGRKAEKAEFGTLIIDKTAPTVSIKFSGVEPKNGYYYASHRQAIITVKDANFDPEGVIIDAMEGNDEWYPDELPELGSWTVDEENGTATAVMNFDKDGDYGFKVQATDKAGNESEEVTSGRFVIDTVAPVLKITGVEDHSANKGRVAPIISFSDLNMKLEDQKITIRGTKNGEVHPVYQREKIPNGFLIRYDNFAQTKEMDDVYTMKVEICDLAGNTSEEKLRFSVNRFGSTFMLSDDTEALVDKYYTRKPPVITITEVNVDPIEWRDVSRSKDGKIAVLKKDRDYKVEASNEGSWHSYVYTIAKSNFEEDGNYAVEIYTEDLAENRMDNGSCGNQVKFAVDGTVPSIAVSGLRKNGTYEGRTHNVAFDAKDNLSLKNASVYVDGEELVSYDMDELKEADGREKFVLTEDKAPRTVELRATDQAGNVLIKKYVNVVVTTDKGIIDERRSATSPVNNLIDVISQDKEENGGAVVNMVYIALGAVLLLMGVFAFMLYRRTYSTGQES